LFKERYRSEAALSAYSLRSNLEGRVKGESWRPPNATSIMTQDPKREPVNFGYIIRRIRECLPEEIAGEEDLWVLDTITGLYALSGAYLLKEDLDAGHIKISGRCGYSQLAEFCRITREGAKKRCERIRDRYHILSWRKTKLGIQFSVRYSGVPDSTEHLRDVYEPPSQVPKESSQVPRPIESGTESLESGTPAVPTLSYLSNSSVLPVLPVFRGKDIPSETGETPDPQDPPAPAKLATHTQNPVQPSPPPPTVPPHSLNIDDARRLGLCLICQKAQPTEGRKSCARCQEVAPSLVEKFDPFPKETT
jgi:hypothetical protein